MELYKELIQHHSPGNRYVYFPPTKRWDGELQGSYRPILSSNKMPVTLYFHIPFCQQMCTFCGCNINLSKKKEDHLEYVSALTKEWDLKQARYSFEENLSKKDIYLILGGGTPTDLHPEALSNLLQFIKSKVGDKVQFGISEANPKTINQEFVDQMRDIGISSFSFGVQDFSIEVCQNVNRHQSMEDLTRSFSFFKEGSLRGIDLIWGLPKQNSKNLKNLWEAPLKSLSPDWISYYPLAEVPWMKTYQDAYGEFNLPLLEEKYRLYQEGVELFETLDYHHSGFGHFIKKSSPMFQWVQQSRLQRTVSGLIPNKSESLIGFGVGALTLGSEEFHQNEKVLEKYKALVLKKSRLPLVSKHSVKMKDAKFLELRDHLLLKDELPDFRRDEILSEFPQNWFKNNSITPEGRHFLKNILQSLEKKHFGASS